jgi:heme-degrading monooxygenase HmoA
MVPAVATFAAVRPANRAARVAEQAFLRAPAGPLRRLGHIGFWQAAIRDPSDDQYGWLGDAIAARNIFLIELLYSDHEGGPRALRLFTLAPARTTTGSARSSATGTWTDRTLADRPNGGRMIVHLAIHTPKPEGVEPLIGSMQLFAAAGRKQPGLREVHTMRDSESGKLLGLAIWESMEAFERGVVAMRAAVQDDPFPGWEEGPPEVHLFEDV